MNTAGPRLICHRADREEPTPNRAYARRLECRQHAAQLEAMRDAIEHGDVDSSDLPRFHQALNDSVAFAIVAMAEKPGLDRAIVTELPAELRKVRREYAKTSCHDRDAGRLEAVEVNGSTERGARLGYFRSPLPDGTYGYLQRRGDDCLRAALATAIQTPITEVPDLRADELAAAGMDPEEIQRIAVQNHRAVARTQRLDDHGTRRHSAPRDKPALDRCRRGGGSNALRADARPRSGLRHSPTAASQGGRGRQLARTR
jgi:hypothetical protein